MKTLLSQFIDFYKFFSQLEETDKEELNKEMNVFVERLKEIDFDTIDNQDLIVSMLIGDIEGKYTNFGRLYNHFIQFMDYSINEVRKNNMNLINPDNLDNFTFHFKNFINLMYELNDMDNSKVKELIEIQNRNNPDKEYINKIRNNLDRFIPVVSNSLDEIVNDELTKDVYDIRDKYIISSELAKIINVERSAIDYHIKGNEFPNMKQKGKGFKIEIPFKDIDKFCLKHSKYSKLWNEYKNNL